MTTIDTERLAEIVTLDKGSHKPPNGNFAACVMEAVAYVSGEPWSDHPECACPVITAFLVNWNDALSDTDRTRLLVPLIPKVVGTRGSAALANRRATMAVDWFIRVQTPAWLRLAGLTTQAEKLEAFPEIVDFAKTPSIKPTLDAIRSDATAAGAAAGAAAGVAARAAARAAAWDAAWDAAWAAAWDALKDTTAALQLSAVDLVERMCALTDEDLSA